MSDRRAAPVQKLLDAMTQAPEIAELRGSMMIRAELVEAADVLGPPPAERARHWANVALYARLMSNHAAWLARRSTADRPPADCPASQLTPPPPA